MRPAPRKLLAAVGDPKSYREVVFCGFGKPTLRLKILIAVATEIRRLAGRVRVNTDGLANLVHRSNVLPQLAQCVDALSVSMNAQDADIYERYCRPLLPGSYEAMLDFLAQAPNYIPEVTATAIEGLTGVDTGACRQIAHIRNAGFRVRYLDILG